MRLDEVNWARLLPYDRGNEDAEFEREFIDQFKVCVLSGNAPGISAMLTQLDNSYMALKLDVRIDLCRILYELVTTHTLELSLFAKCCVTLARMLRREEQLTADDIAFDWRQLYDLTHDTVVPKVWQDNPIQQRSKLKCIVELVCEANRFFPQSAAMEVLDELLPKIQFNSMDWQAIVIQLFTLFVPTARAPTGTSLVTSGAQSTDPQRWLPTIFSLWTFNLRMSVFDAYLMNLVTTLVLEQQGQLQLTNEQVRFVFASGLHFFNLPVSRSAFTLPRSVVVSITDTTGFFRMPANGMLPLKEERAHTFARFIVYTVHVPETLELFEQLVQMIEPFYHPSNNGSWSSMLARFLRYLAKELLQRSRAEAAEDCKVPQDARLTRKMRRRFVVPVRTLAMLLLFSKGEDAVSMSHSTLKHLAELEPDMIFRPLLDTLYTAVDSVTETHRMISAMRALAKLATTLSNFAHYPEGAQHVAPLLMLTLPGIDVNDPTKSYFALSFIYNLCHNGVVFDELVATGDMPTVRTASMEEDQDPEEPPELDMQQIEWTTRASTAQFEVWIDQYLRRVFALMDNLSSSLDSSAGQLTDIKLESMAAHATELVLIQSGARYHPMVARLITEFATSITSLSAVGGVSKVVSAFAGALPELALANLLPRCCEHITEEVANGVGQTPSLSRFTRSHADTTLIWYASMLAALTESQDGRPLLKYKEQLLHAIEQLVDTCQSRHVYSVGARLLYNTLAALTRTAPARGRSVAEDVWNSAEFRENHFRYWGRHPDVADPEFAIEWHVPNADEVAFAQELMRRIVEPRIGQLSAHIDALAAAREPSSADSVTLHRLLVTLRFGIRGLGGMAPPPGAPIPDDALIDALIEGDDANGMPARRRLGLPVAGGYVFAAGSAGQIEVADIRRRAAEVAGKALEFVEQRSEGNVENSKAAILLTETAVCHHATERSTFASVRRTWDYGIDGFALDSSHSIMPRLYAERRAQLTHIARQLHNTRFVGAAESTNSLAAQLARLCLSAYSEVRSYAVSALDNVMAVAPQSKYALVPRFLDELGQSADSDPERMLGALRVLDTQPMRRACLRDWRFFPTMVLALCRAQHEDKPQVKKAIRNTAVVQVMHVTAPVEPAAPPAQVCEMVSALSGSGVLLDAPVAASRAVCVERYDATVTAHAQLVDALLDILRDAGTTWRFAALAGYYLDQLTTVRTPPSPRLARTLAELLTSDLLLFRETSVLNLAQLLGVIKRRSKEACPDIAVAQRRRTLSCPEVIQPEADGPVADSKAYTDLCARALAGDADAISAPFVDNPAAGWLAWPTTAKAYIAPPAEAVEAYNRIDSASQAAYDAVRAELFADGKWDAIARLFAVEGARAAENEMFGTTRAQLFTQAFALFGSALLDRAWAAIEALAHDHERVSAQRAASELVGGLLRGSKHWSQAALDAMWARLVPLLDAAFARLRPDTLVFWQSALKYAFARRDPRRFVPVLRVLLYTRAFDPQAEAPFAEAAKLELLRIALGAWDWRVASAVRAAQPRLLDALAHPYKQVRDAAASAMYMLAASEFAVAFPCAADAVDALARAGPLGRDYSCWSGTPRTQALVADMAAQVAAWKAEHVPSNEATSNYARGSKTLLAFFFSGFRYGPRRLALAHAPGLLAQFSELQELHDDDEAARLAAAVLQFLAQVLYTAPAAEDVAARLLALLDSSLWHVVTKSLPLLCTLTFANRFVLARDVRARILDTTALFLEHDQIEVRHAASASLTSLVKCASSRVIADINQRFSAKLGAPLPRRRGGRPARDPGAYARRVLERHAGVLGLSCLVLAFPYTIPEWMPGVLVQLSGCIDDPNPIQSTVQRTFAEFRRTHMDTWHEDRKRFSSEQLEILTDMLVSPCYYA